MKFISANPPKKIGDTSWLKRWRLPFLDLRGWATSPRTAKGRWSKRASLALAIPVYLVFLLPGLYFVPRAVVIAVDGVDLEAKIYEGEYYWSKSRGDVWYISYQYTHNSQTYRARNSVSPVSEQVFQVGDTVRVRVSDSIPFFHVPQERPHWYAKMWVTAGLLGGLTMYLAWSAIVSALLIVRSRR